METITRPLPVPLPLSSGDGHDLVVVGASAGGIHAISTLLSALPEDLSAAVMIVFHVAPDSGSFLPRMLGAGSPLPISFAEDGTTLRRGEVRIAPPDMHLVVEPGMMRVVRGPRENRFRPAIDPLFRSAAWAYGPRVVGVLLSGMLNDGTAGLWAIKTCGGIAVVQDPADALYGEMPQSALETLPVDHCLPLSRIAPTLAELVKQPAPSKVDFHPPEQLEIETKMASQTDETNMGKMNRIGKLSPFTCPSCHGSLWEVFDDYVLRYRCHTGHAFTADSLEMEQNDEFESALFGALRALEENARLARSVAERSRRSSRERIALAYNDKADEAERNADAIRNMIRRSPANAKP